MHRSTFCRLSSLLECPDLLVCCSKPPGVYAVEWGAPLKFPKSQLMDIVFSSFRQARRGFDRRRAHARAAALAVQARQLSHFQVCVESGSNVEKCGQVAASAIPAVGDRCIRGAEAEFNQTKSKRVIQKDRERRVNSPTRF